MPIPSVVLDTNVVVSAHLSSRGLEHVVFQAALDGRLQLFISLPILMEYENVLRRPKFPILPEKVTQSIALIRQASTLVSPAFTLTVSPDEGDNRFLECAEAAGADLLVTGNRRHFPELWKSTRVVSARECVEFIFSI